MPGGVDGEHGVEQLLELHAKRALPPVHGVDALARSDPPGLLEGHAREAPVGLLGLVEREEALVRVRVRAEVRPWCLRVRVSRLGLDGDA